MGVERQGSKTGGGYVGGFLHLFDWNAKSRKKLFSSKSDQPAEKLKQKKRQDEDHLSQLQLIDRDDSLGGSSFKGSSEYSYASSVTGDDVGGSKAPGVVAKLMGLDSLPTSNFSESYSPYIDSRSLKNSYYDTESEDFHDDHQITHPGNFYNRAQEPLRNNIDTKHQKIISRPFEKFQSEVLPPKSAKSIPLTHHKLLSPIKSGGIHPSKNAVHIMEAAARIIESGNQVSTTARIPPVGSSLSLKIRDMKERAEAAKRPSKLAEASQKPAESIAAKSLKGQSMNKSWNESLETKTIIATSKLEECSVGSKNKGKSVSLAIQAKANVQKRGVTPNSSRNTGSWKEQGELMSSPIFKSQPASQRGSKKSSTNNSPFVLRQNNQKQNSLVEREKVASKSLCSTNSQGRKVMSGESSLGRQRSSSKHTGNSKVGSRKIGREATKDGKELPYSSTGVTRKKRCIDGDFNFQKDQAVADNGKKGKANQFNGVIDSKFSWGEDSKRNGMDVVSFTFTAPMGQSASVPDFSTELFGESNAFAANFHGKNVCFNSGGPNGIRSSSAGHNVIGSDALSTLLEQKLRELTLGAESSCNKAGASGDSLSFQDQTPAKTVVKSHKLHVEGSKTRSQTDNVNERWNPVFSSTTYEEGRISKHKVQEVEDMFDCGSNGGEVRNLLRCRHPSPISILESSIFAESCNSSDTGDSNSTEGVFSSKQSSSSVQAQDVLNMRCLKKFHVMEADTDLSDSASSSSTRVVATKHVTVAVSEPGKPAKWELQYVKKILYNTETMYKNVSTGQTSEIVDPRLFDKLESEEDNLNLNLQRKVLFDCVGECMDLKFRPYVGGGYRAWEKGLSVARRKEWLAEEAYREISSWEAMGDCMVDELVDKDMSSSQCGKWLDYSAEAFELGVDIERRILNSLLNEVISDMLVL